VNKTVVVDLLPTVFEDNTDKLGFINQDPDEYEFLVADSNNVADFIGEDEIENPD